MPIVPTRLDQFGRPINPSPTFPVAAPNVRMPPVTDEMDYDVSRRMQELYTPEMESQELFNKILGQYPQRTRPSLIREIGSSLAGLGPGGYDTAVKAREEPFRSKLEDWKNVMEPAQQAMINERLANVNLRTLANQIVSQELADKRLERAVARDKVQERQGDVRLQNQAESLKIARARARGGEIRIDPASGQGRMFFKDGSSIDIDLSQLPEEERLELIQENALARIRESASSRADTRARRTKTEVIDDPDNPGKRILVTIDQDTGEVMPASYKRPEKPPVKVTPAVRGEAEEARVIDARAKQLKSSNSKYSPYIEMKNGRFVRIKPPGILFGPSEELYKEIYQAIYGTQAPPTIAASQTAAPNTAAPNPNELVEVINPQGKRVRIRKSQLPEALKQKYREIK